jgi:hypothetical protein
MTVGRIPVIEGGIQPTIFDAKADLLTATANDTPARLAVGTNGQVLTADSAEATGLKWATPSTPKLSFVTPSSDFSTSSTSYVDVTGYTITITPVSATNKIQVTANLGVQIGTSTDTQFKLLVDGVNVAIRSEAPFENGEGEVTIVGYVSNLAASAKVCKLQMRSIGGISTTVYGSTSGYISNLGVLEVY